MTEELPLSNGIVHYLSRRYKVSDNHLQFHLYKRNADDLKYGCPECIYRATHGVGVFESEEKFLAFLRNWYAPRYGDCTYVGIMGTDNFNKNIVRIYKMNYELLNSKKQEELAADKLAIGDAAIVLCPSNYAGHLVIKCHERLQSVTDPSTHWSSGSWPVIKVRLLAPGEEYTIRGK